MLKPYSKNQSEKIKFEDAISSGVACDEKNCDGEMMVETPIQWHPELKGLRRAHCKKCNWLGWV